MATVARTSDAELLLRLRKRDREAWEELYAEYQPRLRGFAYRLAGQGHAASLTMRIPIHIKMGKMSNRSGRYYRIAGVGLQALQWVVLNCPPRRKGRP